MLLLFLWFFNTYGPLIETLRGGEKEGVIRGYSSPYSSETFRNDGQRNDRGTQGGELEGRRRASSS